MRVVYCGISVLTCIPVASAWQSQFSKSSKKMSDKTKKVTKIAAPKKDNGNGRHTKKSTQHTSRCKITFYSTRKKRRSWCAEPKYARLKPRGNSILKNSRENSATKKWTWDFIDSPWWSKYTAAASEKFSPANVSDFSPTVFNLMVLLLLLPLLEMYGSQSLTLRPIFPCAHFDGARPRCCHSLCHNFLFRFLFFSFVV